MGLSRAQTRMGLTAIAAMTLLLAGSPWSPAQEDADELKVLLPGQFHAEEVSAQSGETWQALYADEYGFILKPVTLQVDTVYDPVVDADPGKPSGKRVSVQGGPLPETQSCKVLSSGGRREAASQVGQPILLLSGMEGSARTSRRIFQASQPKTFLYPGQVLDVTLDSHYYHLMAYGDAREDNTIARYRLLLWEGETFFPVLNRESLPLFDAPKPQILWIGDLNGDKRLDILMERSDHYNVSELVLFFSDESPLLREVASFRVTGC